LRKVLFQHTNTQRVSRHTQKERFFEGKTRGFHETKIETPLFFFFFMMVVQM